MRLGENLRLSFVKSPPAQSWNVLQQKDCVFFPPSKYLLKQVRQKIALADIKSFVPEFAGGICIH